MQKISEELLVSTPVFNVVKKEFEGVGFKPVGLNCNDWVMAIVIDEFGNSIFVKQTRWGLEDETIEFPCGTVEPGEDPKVAAQRELLEETGIDLPLESFQEIADFNPNPAYFNNHMHIYAIYLEGNKTTLDLLNSAKSLKLDENEDCKPFVSKVSNLREELCSHGMGALGFLFITMRNWLKQTKN